MTVESPSWKNFQQTSIDSIIDYIIFNEDLDYLKYIFSENKISNEYYNSLLLSICRTGNLDMIKFIVDEIRHDPNSEATVTQGILESVNSGHPDAVNYLISLNPGIPVNVVAVIMNSGNKEMIDCLKKYKLI